MAQIEKDTFAGTKTNEAFTFPSFTDGWIANDGGGDLTITLANGNILTLKPYESHNWTYRNGSIYKGFTANGTTTYRYAYVI